MRIFYIKVSVSLKENIYYKMYSRLNLILILLPIEPIICLFQHYQNDSNNNKQIFVF